MISTDAGIIFIICLTIISALAVFTLALFLYVNVSRHGGRLRLNEDGVRDLSYDMTIEAPEDEHDSEEERRNFDSSARRARDWQKSHPPSSLASEITLSQFLTIQEKGVQAWSFESDYIDVATTSVLVSNRTECTFMETDEPCAVLSNLPLPKFVNHVVAEVVYWEVKLFDLPENTHLSIGLATKPWPSFRMPGWNRFSVAYHSQTGNTSYNSRMNMLQYGPSLREGDVLGVGFRAKTGTVFFTKNGKKLPDAFAGLLGLTLFPCIGADGPATTHVNLGQLGFVFIEANVKKWGLAPMQGTLAPPPAYGKERGSILLESDSTAESSTSAQSRQWVPSRPSPLRHAVIASTSDSSGTSLASTQPSFVNASTNIALSVRRRASLNLSTSAPHASGVLISTEQSSPPDNPPTPNSADISLSSLRQVQDFTVAGANESEPELHHAAPEQSLPPGYASIDPITYAQGLNFEVPAEMLLRMG